MVTEERKFSVWRPLFGKMCVYICELDDEEVEVYLRHKYWFIQEDSGTSWPYKWQNKPIALIDAKGIVGE